MHKRTLNTYKERLKNNGQHGEKLLEYIEKLEADNKKFTFKIVALESQLNRKCKPVNSSDSVNANSNVRDDIIKELKQEVFNLRQELGYYREKIKEYNNNQLGYTIRI